MGGAAPREAPVRGCDALEEAQRRNIRRALEKERKRSAELVAERACASARGRHVFDHWCELSLRRPHLSRGPDSGTGVPSIPPMAGGEQRTRSQQRRAVSRTRTRRSSPRCRAGALFPPSAGVCEAVFSLSTVAVGPFYIGMTLAPNSSATRFLMRSFAPYAALGAVFTYLLPSSVAVTDWNELISSFSASSLANALSHTQSASMEWTHLSAWDLLASRVCYWDGQKNNVPTRHSVALCALLGPVGALSHFITRALIARKRGEQLVEPTLQDMV